MRWRIQSHNCVNHGLELTSKGQRMRYLQSPLARPLKTWAAPIAILAAISVPVAHADEADAKRLMKSMSDYLASQQSASFDYDASFEVISKDHQKVALVSSGTVTLTRPDKIRVTRHGGF